MEKYPSLVEGTGLENREVGQPARGFESLFLRHLIYIYIAGWSSSVARRAHNPKVVGSNPTPATKQVTLKFFLSVFLIHYVIERRAISYNYFERRQKEE